METLKDKAHDEYISNEYVADKIFDYEDVKEALLEFDNFILTYIPAKDKCDNCKKDFCIMYRRTKFIDNDYSYCDNCLRLKIFGDFKNRNNI